MSRPSICKRHGCEASRARWMLVCAECWLDVPAPDRQRYTRARRARLTRIAGEIGRELLRALGRKTAAPNQSTQAFRHIAAITGDRTELEAAE